MFKSRSHNKELLDGDAIPAGDLRQNLRELHTINSLLGGYRISFKALEEVLQSNQPAVMVDIGCGGGDTVKAVYKWSIKKNYKLQVNGVDIKDECIAYSKNNNSSVPAASFICDDYRNCMRHIPKIDILHASLFCHHLSNEEIVQLVRFAIDNGITLVINDLERNPLAYYSIKMLTRLFSGSYLVRNDAPLSVLRGFKKQEWRDLITQAGAKKFSIKNRWAFRHEVIVYS